MSKFSKAPGAKAQPPQTREEFIQAAGKPPVEVEVYPWEDLDDKKRRSPFNVRFTDAEIAKLKYIAQTTPDSMHEFCLKALVPAIDAKIAELTGKRAS